MYHISIFEIRDKKTNELGILKIEIFLIEGNLILIGGTEIVVIYQPVLFVSLTVLVLKRNF